MRKPTKEQMKNLFFIIAVICLLKIAFFGVEIRINTQKMKGLPVNIYTTTPVVVESRVSLKGTEEALSVILER